MVPGGAKSSTSPASASEGGVIRAGLSELIFGSGPAAPTYTRVFLASVVAAFPHAVPRATTEYGHLQKLSQLDRACNERRV